jgi:hypothetical protein
LRWLLVSVVVATCVLAPSASAFDRKPVTLQGLQPDSWGLPTTGGESALKSRYPGVAVDYCVGVNIPGDPDSSFIRGLTRYWDKLVCFGTTHTTGKTVFGVVVDAKGANGQWIIYRLKDVSLSALQTP